MNSKFALYMQYIAAALATVMTVEQTVSNEVPGTTKGQIVLDLMQAGANAVGQMIPEPHVSFVTGLISDIANSMNKRNVFSHKPKPETAVP